MVDGQQTDDGPRLYFKLNNEPKGSGELKNILFYGEVALNRRQFLFQK